jgi:DNA (cytosine-5)-methyltransferase 1
LSAYYNEFDKKKAAWLRELIRMRLIAPGEVDERSIHDVCPEDLKGFKQCHFFAGIGVWSYALRLAKWPDDREVWTGSCPCPSFASNGKQRGFADPRHLWPEWSRLVGECRPAAVLGEQVEAALGYGWWDLVAFDLERAGYAAGAAVLTSAHFGGVDIRHRLYFVGMAEDAPGLRRQPARRVLSGEDLGGSDAPPRRVAQHPAGARLQSEEGALQVQDVGGRHASLSGLADAQRQRERHPAGEVGGAERARAGQEPQLHEAEAAVDDGSPAGRKRASRPEDVGENLGEIFRGALGEGHWADADWLLCRDQRWRPVEPGTFPLDPRPAEGVGPGGGARELRLKGYGDAINAQVAKGFILSVKPILKGGNTK